MISPNVLSVARAAAAVPVALLVLRSEPEAAGLALAVFALAALSDLADGALARRQGSTSDLGAFLDPLADKLLVGGSLAALAVRGVVPAWVVLIVLAREALVTWRRGAPAARGAGIAVRWAGKAKALTQDVAIAGLLLDLAVPTPAVGIAASLLLAVAVALTIISGLAYFAPQARRAEG